MPKAPGQDTRTAREWSPTVGANMANSPPFAKIVTNVVGIAGAPVG